MIIGSCQSQPGSLEAGTLPIPESSQALDIYIFEGEKPGPVGFIMGGMHGDEINGPRLVERVMRELPLKDLAGTLILVPLMNPSGFLQSARVVPENNQDLNRSFADTSVEGHAHNIARAITEHIIPLVDFGIDCHDAGGVTALLPQPRVHVDGHGQCSDGCTVPMGKLFGTRFVLQREGEPGMMAIEIFKRFKKPILTVEIGGGLMLWEKLLDEGVRGIENVLKHHAMLPGDLFVPEEQVLVHDSSRSMQFANTEGLLKFDVTLGQEVHSGDKLAVIALPGKAASQVIVADHCGPVFSIKTLHKASVGDELISILQTHACALHHTEPVGAMAVSQGQDVAVT